MKQKSLLHITYFIGFLFSFIVALTVYSNSSYLATKIPEVLVGILYTVSAIFAIVGLFIVPRLIARIGTRPVMGFLILANIGNLLVLILSSNIILITCCFVIFFAFNTLLYLGLDILVEQWSESTNQGSVRGIYLTLNNIGYMTAPLLGGLITDRIGYGFLYGLVIFLSIPIFIITVGILPNSVTAHPSKHRFFILFKQFMKNRSRGSIFMINFILQFFYAWMVIYTPLYLHEHVGIAWDTIGILFAIMLSAFVIFQYAAGRLADRFHCEKAMITFGLITMGVATLFVTRAHTVTFWTLAAILFTTRIGASIVEVMTESYFFKHINKNDTGSIGFFRNTYPFAYIIAPIIGTIILEFADIKVLFPILACICLVSVLLVRNITSDK